MKNLTLFLVILFGLLLASNTNRAQSNQSAADYMERIIVAYSETENETWQYLKAVTRGYGARKVERKRQKLLIELRNTRYAVQKTGKFNSDDSLRSAVVDYLKLNYSVLRGDFDRILDMEDIAEQSYDLMEAYLMAKEQANDKLHNSFEKVVLAQERFAEKHNIILYEAELDKTSEKIKKASELLKYYNQVYLIFFKSYKQEAYVLDALQHNDVSSIVQNTNALTNYSVEGLEKLENLNDFQGDPNLKNGAKKMLNFYIGEAEKDFPAITDFFIKKDNYEKIERSFQSISRKNRTQQDVEQYNNAVNEYNEAALITNKIMETANNERKKALDEWNETVDKFFDAHSK